MKGFAARSGGPAIVAAALLFASGCAWFGGKQMEVSGALAGRVGAERMIDPATRSEAFHALFPEQPKLEFWSARLHADAHWSRSEKDLLMHCAATGRDRVRLRGFVPEMASTLFDILLADGRLTVVLATDGRATFNGPVSGEKGSPLRRVFGVEPGDLWNVIYVGQRVAKTEWKKKGWLSSERTLYPVENAADGLQWIQLDKRTGLPREARWQRDGHRWDVRYLEWAVYRDATKAGDDEVIPLPRRLEIEPSDPAVTLTLEMPDAESYKFGETIHPRMFESPDTRGTTVQSLDGLEHALREALSAR